MPNRMLRDWTRSEKLNLLSANGERFFTRLIMKADDYGCYYADARILKADLFPLSETIRKTDLLHWMAECQKAELVVLYQSDDKEYVQIHDFRQRLDKAKSKFPLPSDTESLTTDIALPAELEPEKEIEKERNTGATALPPDRKKKKIFIAPELAEVKQFFLSIAGNSQSPGYWPPDRCSNQASTFFDHYAANGWVQAKGKPIVDWKAASRNWIRRSRDGTFDSKTVREKQKSVPKVQEIDTSLSKIQTEINFLYGRFLEDQITVISVDAVQYNELFKAGLIAFSADEKKAIGLLANSYMDEKKLIGPENLTRFSKCFGVLEFFKQCKAANKEVIYE